MKIKKLEQTRFFEIIFMLIEGDKKTSEITYNVSPQSAYKVFDILLELGLAKIERREWNTKYYCLTEKGKKVAAKLAEIEKILQED